MAVVKSNKRSQEEIYRSLGLSYPSGGSSGNQMIDPTPGYVTPDYGKAIESAGGTVSSSVSKGSNYNPQKTSSSKSSSGMPEFSMSDRTQNYYNALDDIEGDRPDEFETSDLTNQYLQKLQDVEGQKPEAFQSKYTAQIDSLLNTIQHPEKFDLNSNDTYRQLYDNYKESYMTQGRKAMQDAMGQAAGMTGGYGSTYASQVGQQAYDNYLQQLNDKNISLYGMALDDYWKNRSDYYNQLGAVQGQDATDYGRYRDTVGDWKDDRAYYANRYDTGYNRDYSQYRDTVSDWQTDRAYYANQAQTGYGNDWASYQSGLDQYNQAQQMAFQQDQADRAAEQWQYEQDYKNAVNYLNGLDTRSVIDAWNNTDDPVKQAALQQALATAQAANAKSSGGGRSGGSGRRSSGYSSKGKADDASDLTVDRFAGQLKMAINNGEITHDDAEQAIKSYVSQRGIQDSNIAKIAKQAGVNLEADDAKRAAAQKEMETFAGQIRMAINNGELTHADAVEELFNYVDGLDLTDNQLNQLAKLAGVNVNAAR